MRSSSRQSDGLYVNSGCRWMGISKKKKRGPNLSEWDLRKSNQYYVPEGRTANMQLKVERIGPSSEVPCSHHGEVQGRGDRSATLIMQ